MVDDGEHLKHVPTPSPPLPSPPPFPSFLPLLPSPPPLSHLSSFPTITLVTTLSSVLCAVCMLPLLMCWATWPERAGASEQAPPPMWHGAGPSHCWMLQSRYLFTSVRMYVCTYAHNAHIHTLSQCASYCSHTTYCSKR